MRRLQDEPPLRVIVIRRNDPNWRERYLTAMQVVMADDQPYQPEDAEAAAEEQES